MISVTQLMPHLFKIFMLAKTDGMEFKVKHAGTHKVYLVNIMPSAEPYPKSTWQMRKKIANRKGNVALDIVTCEYCESPVISGICVNKTCTQTHDKPKS